MSVGQAESQKILFLVFNTASPSPLHPAASAPSPANDGCDESIMSSNLNENRGESFRGSIPIEEQWCLD